MDICYSAQPHTDYEPEVMPMLSLNGPLLDADNGKAIEIACTDRHVKTSWYGIEEFCNVKYFCMGGI